MFVCVKMENKKEVVGRPSMKLLLSTTSLFALCLLITVKEFLIKSYLK